MEKNTVKEIFKSGLSLVAGIGIGIMVKTGVGMLTPETAGKLTKLCCKAGGLVLASALGRVADNEINKIDEDVQNVKKAITDTISIESKSPAFEDMDVCCCKEDYQDEPCNEPAK